MDLDLASGDTVTMDAEGPHKNMDHDLISAEVSMVKNLIGKMESMEAETVPETVVDALNFQEIQEMKVSKSNDIVKPIKEPEETRIQEQLTPQTIAENEIKLKERIDNCRQTIEMLKRELSNEKAKREVESKHNYEDKLLDTSVSSAPPAPVFDHILDTGSSLGASVAKKLSYDDKFFEYETQLQKYQTTLTMAQIEKKKAVRKQVMAKAFELKLLEVENQLNIELLKVKQNLQFLEPLRMALNQWQSPLKERTDKNMYEFPSLDLEFSRSNIRFYDDFTSSDQPRDSETFEKFDRQSTSSQSSSNRI